MCLIIMRILQIFVVFLVLFGTKDKSLTQGRRDTLYQLFTTIRDVS